MYTHALAECVAEISPIGSLNRLNLNPNLNLNLNLNFNLVIHAHQTAEAQQVLSAAFAERRKGKNKTRVLELVCHKETGALSFNGSVEEATERAVEVVARELEESLRQRVKSLTTESVKQLAELESLASQETDCSFANMKQVEARNMAPLVKLARHAMELSVELSRPPGSGDGVLCGVCSVARAP